MNIFHFIETNVLHENEEINMKEITRSKDKHERNKTIKKLNYNNEKSLKYY